MLENSLHASVDVISREIRFMSVNPGFVEFDGSFQVMLFHIPKLISGVNVSSQSVEVVYGFNPDDPDESYRTVTTLVDSDDDYYIFQWTIPFAFFTEKRWAYFQVRIRATSGTTVTSQWSTKLKKVYVNPSLTGGEEEYTQAQEDAISALNSRVTALEASGVEDEFGNFVSEISVKSSPTVSFAQGGLNSGTGQTTTVNQAIRIRTGAIAAGDYGVEIEPLNGYKYYVYEYSGSSIGTFLRSHGWYTEKKVFSGAPYYRFVVANGSDSEITPSDSSNISISTVSFTDPTLSLAGKAADAATVGTNALLYKRQLAASEDLNEIFENGIYRARGSSRPSNSPTANQFVMYIMGAPSEQNQKVEMLIDSSHACYVRHRDSGGEWGQWTQLVNKNDLDDLENTDEYLKSAVQSMYNNNLPLIGNLVKGARNAAGGITTSSPGITNRELYRLDVGTKVEVRIDGDWVYSVREGDTTTSLTRTHHLVQNESFVVQHQYVAIILYRVENGDTIDTSVSDFTGQVVLHVVEPESTTSISDEFSRDIPENIGVANVIRRAYQVVKAAFTAESDIPHFGDTIIKEGADYIGIPYSSVRPENLYVPNCVSIESFMTAAKNPNSYLYTRRMNIPGYSGHCYVGSVCSSFVAWCYGIDDTLPTTVSFASYPGFNKLDPEHQNWKSIKLGDAIIKSDLHIYIVTDVYRNRFGEVAYVELSEETRAGNSKARSTTYYRDKVTELISSGYSIYRYSGIENVTYDESPWVHVDASEIKEPMCNDSIIPRRGDKANWHYGEDVVIDIMKTGFTGYELTNESTSTTTTGSVSGSVITLSNLAIGSYKLRLTGTSNSDWVYFDVIRTAGTTFEVQSGRHVKVTPATINGEIGSVAFCSNNPNNGADHLAVRSFHVFTDAEKGAGYAIVAAPDADSDYAVNDVWYMRCMYKTRFGIYSGELTLVDVTSTGTIVTETDYALSPYIENYPT